MNIVWSGLAGGALGAVLTGVFSVFRDRAAARSARKARRAQAYTEFLVRCGSVMISADYLRVIVSGRSGVKESVAALMGRPPLDVIEVVDLFRRDLDPLVHAWTQVWTSGTQDAITLANQILDRCADLLKVGSEPGQGRGRLSTTIQGPAWAQAQIDSLSGRTKELAELRRDFTALVRRETGEQPVDLFTLSDR